MTNSGLSLFRLLSPARPARSPSTQACKPFATAWDSVAGDGRERAASSEAFVACVLGHCACYTGEHREPPGSVEQKMMVGETVYMVVSFYRACRVCSRVTADDRGTPGLPPRLGFQLDLGGGTAPSWC